MPFFKNSIPSGHRPGLESGGGGSARSPGAREEAHTHAHAHTHTHTHTHPHTHTRTHAHAHAHAEAEAGDPRSTKKQLLKSLVRRGTQRIQGIPGGANKKGASNTRDDDKVAAGRTASNAKEQSAATREVSSCAILLLFLFIFNFF